MRFSRQPLSRLLSLGVFLLLTFQGIGGFSPADAASDRPASVAGTARAKQFLLEGTVDCGRASGQACSVWPLVTVWTIDVTGERQLVTIDLSWIGSQMDRYDQDDLILLEVIVEDDGTLRAVSVAETRDSGHTSDHHIDPGDDKKPSAPAATATIAPTGTGTPAPSATVTPTPTQGIPINLSLSKVPGMSSCAASACSTDWTITVTNAGPGVAHNVVVIDRPLAGLTTVTNAVVSQGSYNTVTNRWTVGTVDIGPGNAQTVTLTFDFSPADVVVGGWQNQAEVEAADETDTNSTPNNGNPAEDDQATELLVDGCGLSPARTTRGATSTPTTVRTRRTTAGC